MNINIDQLLNRAKDMVNVAAKKTNDVVEVSKLKLEGAKLQNELKSLYEKLGIEVFISKKDLLKDDVTCAAIFDEIEELLERIDAVNETVADRQQAGVCPNCGSRIKSENLFCPNCGTALQNEPVEEETVEAEAEPVEAEVVEETPVSEESAPVDPAEDHMNQQDW